MIVGRHFDVISRRNKASYPNTLRKCFWNFSKISLFTYVLTYQNYFIKRDRAYFALITHSNNMSYLMSYILRWSEKVYSSYENVMITLLWKTNFAKEIRFMIYLFLESFWMKYLSYLHSQFLKHDKNTAWTWNVNSTQWRRHGENVMEKTLVRWNWVFI